MKTTHRGSDEGSTPPTLGSESRSAPKAILGELTSLLDQRLAEANELDLSVKLAPFIEEVLELIPKGPHGLRIPDLCTFQVAELEQVSRSEISRRISAGEYPGAYHDHSNGGRLRVPYPAIIHRAVHHRPEPSSNSGEPPLRDIPTYTE